MVIFTVMCVPPCCYFMLRIAQHLHHVLGCASLSKFVGGVPFCQVLGQFLIARQYRNGYFFHEQSWLGHMGCCIFASLCGTHECITGLYRNQSSLVCTVILKLTCDSAGCYTAVLGHWAVLCSLPYFWGWSTTRTVIFELIMTPIRIGLVHKQEGFLPCDSTSSHESNLDNIARDHESDGMKTIPVGLHTPTSISH